MGTKVKRAVIIILPVIFAIAASVAVALLVGGGMRQVPDDTLPEESDMVTASESDAQVNAPTENEDENGESKGLEYTYAEDGSAAVSGIGSCEDKIIRIPALSPDGKPVTEISEGAFKNESELEGVILPESIMRIGKNAFRKSGIKRIELGSTVLYIGECAFAECFSLTEIKVSGANPVYCSSGGVLYDRGMTQLIAYPSGKTDAKYTIPRSIVSIGAMAISTAPELKSLEYAGTEKEWEKVTVASGNSIFDTVTIKFASADK
jgi:hypothetical protein